jgi:hypothetical protein
MYKPGTLTAAERLAKCRIMFIETTREHMSKLPGCTQNMLEGVLEKAKEQYDLKTMIGNEQGRTLNTILVVPSGKKVPHSVDDLNKAARDLGYPIEFEYFKEEMGIVRVKVL